MTLEELGNKVGVGKSTVRKWETGAIKNMGRDKIEKLANALGVSPTYIVNLNIEKPAENIISGLSDEERILIDLFRKLPEDQHQYFLLQLRAVVEAQK